MPALLTHKAIMLLARERVADLRNRLLLKKALGATLTDLELRVLRLATMTHVAMSEADDTREAIDAPNNADWPDGFGNGVSRFAVMGSMGPDIPGLAALLAPAQRVWFDIVHKGTPDGNRERIDARSTDLALEIWKQGTRALADRPTGGPDAARALDRARSRLRAYVLGHLCHIIGDVIAHPFINDVEWHVPLRDTGTGSDATSRETLKFTHSDTEASLDSRVAVETFRRASPRAGQAWGAWWPNVGDVPPELFVGYERAFNEIHKARLDRPDGLGWFEHALAPFTPQVPDADFFRDGYRTLSHAGVGIMYNWGYASWLGFLSTLFLPLVATFPLAFAMPNGRKWFEQSASDAGERATFEALTLPLAMNAFLPLILGGFVASLTSRGVEGITTAGLIGSAVSGLGSLMFFITLPDATDPGAPARWIVSFGLPVAIGLSFTIAAIVKAGQHESRRKALLLIYAAPFLIAGVSGLLLFVFAEVVGSASETAGTVSWGILSGLIVVGGLVALFVLPAKLRDFKLPENAGAFPARRPHDVRLFDRSALFERPGQHDESVREVHFPSSVRPLLRLFWTGAGDFFIRPRHTHLEYRIAPPGGVPGPIRLVPAPITPMTQRQLAEYLTNVVRDGGGANGLLQCALPFPADANVELPPGALFADHGDLAEDRSDEDLDAPSDEITDPDQQDTSTSTVVRAASTFRKLTTSNDDSSYLLFHAPKRAQAVRFDRFGAAPYDERETETVDGPGTISGDGTTITGRDTLFTLFFELGDRIVFNGQARIVTKIDSDVSLVISSPFRPAPDGKAYQRLGTGRERARGYSFVAQPRRASGTGDTIMDIAADLGALLCLGGTSRMIDSIEGRIDDLADKVAADGSAIPLKTLDPVSRVFRNWCLDRRLVDEWRELVLGGSTPNAAAAADPGSRVLLQQGWVQSLRKWMRVVDVHGQSAVDAGRHDAGANDPSNLELSQAMARLLDMPAPVAVRKGP